MSVIRNTSTTQPYRHLDLWRCMLIDTSPLDIVRTQGRVCNIRVYGATDESTIHDVESKVE
jgi:hypothetical protein